jgi:hypothetical protein
MAMLPLLHGRAVGCKVISRRINLIVWFDIFKKRRHSRLPLAGEDTSQGGSPPTADVLTDHNQKEVRQFGMHPCMAGF